MLILPPEQLREIEDSNVGMPFFKDVKAEKHIQSKRYGRQLTGFFGPQGPKSAHVTELV